MTLLLAVLMVAQEDPARAGPFAVAVETRAWRDESRDRNLRTEIWRPTNLPPGARMPVVVYSHGFAGTRLQSRFLCSHLASHGYLVAAPDHAGNTFMDLNLFKAHDSARHRPHDLRVVLDKLETESREPESPLFGRLDCRRAAAVGHSFGGYTALAAVGAWLDLRAKKAKGDLKPSDPDYMEFDDPRFVAAVAHASVMSPFLTADSLRPVVKPVLILGGSRDAQVSPKLHQRPVFENVSGVRYLGVIDGATHFNFMDDDIIKSAPIVVRMSHLPKIERKDADDLVLRQTTAFLERHLRGSTRYDRWLTGNQDQLEWKSAFGPSKR